MHTQTQQEVVTRVNEIFVDLFEVEPAELKPEAKLFTDLKLDSLDAIDLVVSFERVFKIKPPHAEIREIRTMQDVYALVLKYHDAGDKAEAS